MKRMPKVLLLIESSRESGRKLISGIADYEGCFGPWEFNWILRGISGLKNKLEKMDFDGMLVRDIALTDLKLPAGIPIVTFSYGGKDVASEVVNVDVNHVAIAQEVSRHFLGRGFKHFAFCGQQDLAWAVERGSRFTECINTAGFTVKSFWTETGGTEGIQAQDSDALERWLLGLPKPVALMAANDSVGFWVIQSCKLAGIRVPEDCAVIGVDNDPVVCGLCTPKLSSVAVDQRQAGYEAARTLDAMMRGLPPESRDIRASVQGLVLRRSSDAYAVEDPSIEKALAFLYLNRKRSVSIAEVAAASGRNRRQLERVFKEELGQTIQQRHREIRADYVANLLRDTELTLEEIAEVCNFSQASQVTRLFVRVKGKTPSAYRKHARGRS